MRLTLRTLLAYLDDTLAAGEIKTIGEKVAESDNAQELIARIKQVTRKRRLTVPPSTGPGSFEPNDVAEYLDNALDAEKVAEVEKQCLDSEVHLAEIAACHQILTLVLGEPALVPPKAKERMYALVKGRESIPYRKAAPVRKPSDGGGDEEQLPGLSGAWLKFVLPAAAVLLLVALGVTVWALSDVGSGPRHTASVKKDKGEDDKEREKEKDKEQPVKDKDKTDKTDETKDKKNEENKDKNKKTPKDNEADKDKKNDKDKDGGKDGNPIVVVDKDKQKDKDKKKVKEGRRPEPSKDRVALASFSGGNDKAPGILLSRKSTDEGHESWVKVFPKAKVLSDDTLLTLPGFANVIETDSGVRLLMRGSLPEYAATYDQLNLLDASVTLHACKEKEIDLDLTLHRGRIYLSNNKDDGPATVRLRFEGGEVWEITLDRPRDEVGVELWRTYSDTVRNIYVDPDDVEGPFAFLNLVIIRGEVTVNVVNARDSFTERGGGGRAVLFSWDTNKFHGFQRLDRLPSTWDKKPPTAADGLSKDHLENIRKLGVALKDLETRLQARGKDDTPVKAITEARAKAAQEARLLGLYCMGAIGDVNGVLDALGDNDPDHYIDRYQAAYVLRRWVVQAEGNNKSLYDKKNKSGLLVTKYRRDVEASALYNFIFTYPPAKRVLSETYDTLAQGLRSKNVAIAELAWQHLNDLTGDAQRQGQVRFPLINGRPFNAAAPYEERREFANAIDDLIKDEKLPPRPQAPKDKDKGKDKVKDKP